MSDAAFTLTTLALFFINGIPFQFLNTWSWRQQVVAAPVIGSAVLAVSTTILYRFGISPPVTIVLVSAASTMFVALRLLAIPKKIHINDMRIRPSHFATPASFIIVFSLIVLPHMIGGEDFSIFQGNHIDTLNYLSMAVGYATHSYGELKSSTYPINATFLLAEGMLGDRPTVAILYAGLYRAFGTNYLTYAYDFCSALQINLFFSFLYLARALFPTRLVATAIASIGFAIGFFAQYLFDINAWSALLAVPMSIVLLADFTRLLVLAGIRILPASPLGRKASIINGAAISIKCLWQTELPIVLGRTTVVAIGLIYSYPEITPTTFLACCCAFLSAFICYVLSGRIVSVTRLALCCTILGVGIIAVLAPYLQDTIAYMLGQLAFAANGKVNWHRHFQAYFMGRDQNNFDQIAIQRRWWTEPFTLLSLPSDFLSAFLGLYFLEPTASWPLWLRVICKSFVLFCGGFLILGVAHAVTSMFRSRQGLLGARRLQFRYIMLAVVCAFAIPAYLLVKEQYWTAGKAISYLSPFIFFLLVVPAVAPASVLSVRFLSWIIVGAHILSGAYRPYAVWENGNGINYPPPYPTIAGGFKTDVDWDIAKHRDTLARCNLVKVDIENPILERSVENYLIDQSIPWFTLRRQTTHYGEGDYIGTVGSPNGWHDGCLVTDVPTATDVALTLIDLQRSKISCPAMPLPNKHGAGQASGDTVEPVLASNWRFAFVDKSIRCFKYYGGALASGWSQEEDWGVYTDGMAARLVIPIFRSTFPNGAIVELDLGGYLVGERQQRLDITIREKVLAETVFDKSHPSQKIVLVLTAEDLDVNRPLTLNLSLPDAISPSEDDHRKLGAALTGIGISTK